MAFDVSFMSCVFVVSSGLILVLGLGSKVNTSPWLCHDVFDAAAPRETTQAGKWRDSNLRF